MEILADLTFIRRRIGAFDRRTSRYRGKGSLIIDDTYVTIQGRRIHTPIIRAALGIIFFLLSVYLVNVLTDRVLHVQFYERIISIKASVYTILVILSFYLVEYVVTIREDFTVEFDAVRKFTYFPRAQFAALSIRDLPRCSPVMFRCEDMEEVIHALRQKIPGSEFLL